MPALISNFQDLTIPVMQKVDMGKVAAIVLCGGEGTRLFPLTLNRCKPALFFGGHYRLIDVPMSNTLNSGCNKIFIITQFLSASLHHHILQTYRMESHSKGFIEILSAEQKPQKHAWYQGTADAIRQNIEYLSECDVEYFLILSGDQLYQMDFTDMVSFAKSSGADVVISTLPVGAQEAKRMGIMKINSDHTIVDFIEKPQDEITLELLRSNTSDKPFLGSMGIYLFKRKALLKLLKEDPREDFGKHLIPLLVKRGQAVAYTFPHYWEDIGTLESFYNANIALTYPNTPFNLSSAQHPLFTGQHPIPSSILRETLAKNAIICDGSDIAASEITHSIIGPKCHIGTGTTISHSYLFGNDTLHSLDHPHEDPFYTIGNNCTLRNCIIDKQVKIGHNVKLINQNHLQTLDQAPVYIRDGIIVITKGAILPDHFTL